MWLQTVDLEWLVEMFLEVCIVVVMSMWMVLER